MCKCIIKKYIKLLTLISDIPKRAQITPKNNWHKKQRRCAVERVLYRSSPSPEQLSKMALGIVQYHPLRSIFGAPTPPEEITKTI